VRLLASGLMLPLQYIEFTQQYIWHGKC